MKSKLMLSLVAFSALLALWLASPAATHAAACQSTGSGNWTNPTIWTNCDGGYPGQTTNDFVTIQSGHIITLYTSPPNALYRLVIESNAELELSEAGLAFSAAGGTPGLEVANNGSLLFSPGQIRFDASYGTVVSDVTGAVSLQSVEIEGVGVTFNPAAVIEGELIILTGGYVNNIAPTYGPDSVLIYWATGDYIAGAEWYANVSSGQGVPHHVAVELGWSRLSQSSQSTLTLGAADRTLTGDLTIDSSNFVAPPTGNSLFVGGDFGKWSGDFDHNGGTVVFNGSGAQSIDAGGGRIDFNNLVVAAGSHVILPDPGLGGAVFADGAVTNNGRLTQTIYIPLDETEASVVLIKEDSLNGTDTKYIGIDIELVGVPAPLHDGYDVTVSIDGNQDCVNDPSSTPVRRCYDISLDPALEAGESATVKFYYLPGEANGNAEDELTVFHWIGANWQAEIGTTTYSNGGNPRWVQVEGVTNFSPFILADQAPLAVTLASFQAEAQAGSVLLTWETFSDINNTGFNLYRSATPDAPDELLGFVPAQAPGSTQGAAYQWLDESVAAGQTYHYWLQDVSLTGATTLHGPVSATVQAPTAVTLAGLQAASVTGVQAGWLGLALLALVGAIGLLARRRFAS